MTIAFDCARTQSGRAINTEEKIPTRNKKIVLTFDSGRSQCGCCGIFLSSDRLLVELNLECVAIRNGFGLTRQLHRGPMHDPVEIHGGHRAIFQVIAFAGIGIAVFQDTLHDHAIETAVAHDAAVVFL